MRKGRSFQAVALFFGPSGILVGRDRFPNSFGIADGRLPDNARRAAKVGPQFPLGTFVSPQVAFDQPTDSMVGGLRSNDPGGYAIPMSRTRTIWGSGKHFAEKANPIAVEDGRDIGGAVASLFQ
jgi:hypothetical protein